MMDFLWSDRAHGRKRRIERTEGSIRIDYEDDEEEEDELRERGPPGFPRRRARKMLPSVPTPILTGLLCGFSKCSTNSQVFQRQC